MMIFRLTFIAIVLALTTGYSAWFWREPRPPLAWLFWTMSAGTQLTCFWLMRRRFGLSLTRATVFYEFVVIFMWYLPLLIWRERSVSPVQAGGLVLVLAGAIMTMV